jgi:hypothetical protein
LGSDGSAGTRAELVFRLVQELADLGAAAEGIPSRPVPRLDNDLALPDQVRVMVSDLLLAPASDETLTKAAAAIQTTTRAL